MAFSAGLKPFEFDSLSPQRIWNVIDAHHENEKTSWEQTRAICFNVGRFGNSDPKHFPKTLERFWPMPWDKKQGTNRLSRADDILAQHEKMVQRRKQLENKIHDRGRSEG